MSEIRRSNSSDPRKINQKIDTQKKKIPPNVQNNIHPNNLNNDIFISRSGLAKINNLGSCLELDDDDFIVF